MAGVTRPGFRLRLGSDLRDRPRGLGWRGRLTSQQHWSCEGLGHALPAVPSLRSRRRWLGRQRGLRHSPPIERRFATRLRQRSRRPGFVGYLSSLRGSRPGLRFPSICQQAEDGASTFRVGRTPLRECIHQYSILRLAGGQPSGSGPQGDVRRTGRERLTRQLLFAARFRAQVRSSRAPPPPWSIRERAYSALRGRR